MNQRSCRECGGWHDLDTPWPHAPKETKRSHLAAPMIISDTQEDIKSMADGKYYSSKSEMRKGYKAKGLVEVGNDAPTTNSKPILNEVSEKDVATAYRKVVGGYKPKPVKTYSEA